LDLQDSLLVNNGRIAGTTNVYYGATVSGSGSFGAINVLQAGKVAISPSASPIASSFFVSGGSIAGAGQTVVPTTVHSADLVAPNPSDLLVLSGNLGGDGLLEKLGAGTVILSGSGGFGGSVIVSDGTLVLDNPAAVAEGANLCIGGGVFAVGALAPAGVAGQATSVPEPGTLALLIASVCGASVYRRQRSRR
jgi:autotransporter-associated beta strand protein